MMNKELLDKLKEAMHDIIKEFHRSGMKATTFSAELSLANQPRFFSGIVTIKGVLRGSVDDMKEFDEVSNVVYTKGLDIPIEFTGMDRVSFSFNLTKD